MSSRPGPPLPMDRLRRSRAVLTRDSYDVGRVVDHVVADSQDRHRRRALMTTEGGMTFLLDLPHVTMLHDGDGLVLDDGSIVGVAGKPEPLVEITAATAADLARLAWHLGNRHTDVQVIGGRLRIRRDHVLEDMLRGLGADLTPIEAPFDPEAGAYSHHHGHDNGS